LKLWLCKLPGERLYQTIKDIEIMRKFLRDAKINLGLPLGELDPVGEYLRKKKESKKKGITISLQSPLIHKS